MQVTVAKKYQLQNTIGQGGFGDVYKSLDLISKKVRAIKLERRSNGTDMLFYEGRILSYLKDVVGVPRVYDAGFDGDFNYLVMDYSGIALSTYLDLCGGRFSLKTTCLFGIQALGLLETVHNKYILHRDIKPENFLFNQSEQRFYLIDFGLSKRYVDRSGAHIARQENKSFRGTLRYCSLNMHLGIENTRRDDLESLCYVLLFFLKGKLPWQNIKAEVEAKFDMVKKLKLSMKIADLCADVDEGFKDILTYVRNLGFAEYPDYEKIRGILKGIMKRNAVR